MEVCMNLEMMYNEYANKRVGGTNKQISLFSMYLEKLGEQDLERYIKKKWNLEIWKILENILKGGRVSTELKGKLKSWNIESRTIEEYLVKIFYAWFVEDCIYDWLNCQSWFTKKYTIHKGGTDATRELVSANKATGAPDLYAISKKDGSMVHLEISCDNSGYTIGTGLHDLRHRDNGISKFEDLKRRRFDVEVKSVFLLIVDAKNMNVAFLEINNKLIPIREHENPYYNNRMCTELPVSKKLKRWEIIKL